MCSKGNAQKLFLFKRGKHNGLLEDMSRLQRPCSLRTLSRSRRRCSPASHANKPATPVIPNELIFHRLAALPRAPTRRTDLSTHCALNRGTHTLHGKSSHPAWKILTCNNPEFEEVPAASTKRTSALQCAPTTKAHVKSDWNTACAMTLLLSGNAWASNFAVDLGLRGDSASLQRTSFGHSGQRPSEA